MSPSAFIPLTEDTGLIVPLGSYVLNEACRQLAAWRHEGKAVERVSVNVSPVQFTQGTFVDGVRRIELRLEASLDGRRVPGLFGSFAVGSVCSDGAATFGPAVDVDADGPIGHVGVALVDEHNAFVSWWARGSGTGAALVVRRVTASGALGSVAEVATSSSIHPDDVAQMTAVGGALLWAWTESSDPNGVRTAIADVGGL